MLTIYLGVDKKHGEPICLSKHSWDCEWYWGFGYLGNKNLHYHIDSYLDGKGFNVSEVFMETYLTQNNWYYILDMFKQAYALRSAASLYRYGGHITSEAFRLQDTNGEMAKKLNQDLSLILDDVWKYIVSLSDAQYEATNNKGDNK